MIIVGERLNSTRKSVLEAMGARDEAFILAEAVRQMEAGAAFIDLNAAALIEDEIPALSWALPLVQKATSLPVSIDSPNPKALEAGLKIHKGRALLNSVTAEKDRLAQILPLVSEFRPKVIALCMDDRGIPQDVRTATENAERLADALTEAGLDPADVYFDPLVRPIAADMGAARLFLDSLEAVKALLPEFGTIAGLSNVSFGLPERSLINRTLLVLAIGHGLDAVICDPSNTEVLASLKAAEALCGRDPFLKNFLRFARSRKS
jgi:cobalamin-dependent methionine synthase I